MSATSDAYPFPLVFDGHVDTVLSLDSTGRSFVEESDEGHIDLPRARRGGLGGAFFAVYLWDEGIRLEHEDPVEVTNAELARYSDPDDRPPMMRLDYAQPEAMRLAAMLFRAERASEGRARIVRSARELRECFEQGIFAMLLHFEGAEPIDERGDALEVFYQAGFRSLGLTWSRQNIFGDGVPFKFPGSPDHGEGLTPAGKDLVRQCLDLGILIDLSHLNEQGFWDVQKLSTKPLVATHSNAHALCPTPRNLTNKQLDAIRESGGVVGVNFHVSFVRPDGENDPNTPLSQLVDHVEYLVENLGIDGVAIGSDFDGGTMPAELRDVTVLPRFMELLSQRGYDNAALRKIAHENWFRVLGETLNE